MSRIRKLSQTIWHCQYHIVWVPKYRYRILSVEIAREIEDLIRVFSHQMKCESIELNVKIDHVHLLIMIPPNRFKKLRQKTYWVKGYCVDTVGLDGDMIRKYVKYQEGHEKRIEQQRLTKKNQKRLSSWHRWGRIFSLQSRLKR